MSWASAHDVYLEFRFMSWHAVWQEVSLGSRWMCLETAGSYKNTLFNFMTEYVDSSCQTRRLQPKQWWVRVCKAEVKRA